PQAEARAVDTGLLSLCLIARFFHVPADPGELARRHLASAAGASAEDIVRIARRLGLKSRLVKTGWDRLAKTPLPAIAEHRDGSFFVASRFLNDKILVHPPGQPRGRLVEGEEFDKMWSGRLVLLGRRASLSNLSDVFDLR